MQAHQLSRLFLLAGAASLAASASAQIGKTITVDGDASLQWTAQDVVVTQNDTGNGFGTDMALNDMVVTWDATHLYIGLRGDLSGLDNDLVTVWVDGSANNTTNPGWINTTSNLNDTGENRIDRRISNMELLFPKGIAFDLVGGINGNQTWMTDGFGTDDEFNGVRTWNNGDPGNIGYDCCGGEGHTISSAEYNAGANADFEWAIRWDRVFHTVAGSYNSGTGALPTGTNGQIGLLAVLSSNSDDPFLSNQILPNIEENGAATANNPGGQTLSTISTPFSLTGVIVVDIDLNNDNILDLATFGGQPTGDVTTRTTLDTDGPAISADSAVAFWDNTTLRVTFSEDPSTATATNAANYVVTNSASTVLNVIGAQLGTGSQSNAVFLTLSGPLDDGTDVTVSNVQNAAGNATIDPSTFTDVQALDIIAITLDSSADSQTFLPNPDVRGGWDGFNAAFPLSDGGATDDLYPEAPGIQAVDATADDGIYSGRVFVTTNNAATPFTISSQYNFGSLVDTGKSAIRRLGHGYWTRNFNYLTVTGGNETISLEDDTVNRLLPGTVTVTFNVVLPAAEGWNVGDIDTTGTDATKLRLYVQAGPTFGGEGAVPTNPANLIPGEADVTDGLRLNYVSSVGQEHTFTGTATYGPGVPDVSTFRLGYAINNNASIFREEESQLTNAEGVTGGILPEPEEDAPYDNAANYGSNTVHPHVARLADNAFAGRTLNMTFNVPSYDVPAVNAGPGPAAATLWNLYE